MVTWSFLMGGPLHPNLLHLRMSLWWSSGIVKVFFLDLISYWMPRIRKQEIRFVFGSYLSNHTDWEPIDFCPTNMRLQEANSKLPGIDEGLLGRHVRCLFVLSACKSMT